MPGFQDTAPQTGGEPYYQTTAFMGPDIPENDKYRPVDRRDPSDMITELDTFLNAAHAAGRMVVLDAVMLTKQGRACRFITTAPAPQVQQAMPGGELPRPSATPGA